MILMMINTLERKQAIVDYVKSNPGHVYKQFVGEGEDVVGFESPATKISNWKRREDDCFDGELSIRGDRITSRAFDCDPYDDQLRAYTKDDGIQIISVEVVGE